MNNLTLWRRLLYEEVGKLKLDGKVLDLGGLINADYHKLIKGDHRIIVANNTGQNDDVYIDVDIEKKFPIEDNAYDSIICLNVLEHIFDYSNALRESYRVLKDGGTLILSTPFIFQFHSCPNDYWRFTDKCLKRILENSGFREIEIKPIGTGVFSATSQLKTGLYKINILRNIFYAFNVSLDKILHLHKKGESLTQTNFPIGFFVIAKK